MLAITSKGVHAGDSLLYSLRNLICNIAHHEVAHHEVARSFALTNLLVCPASDDARMLLQVQQLNAEELEVAISERDRPLIIDFFATW